MWIKVTERLPEGGEYKKVLTLTEFGVAVEYWKGTHFECEYPVKEATVTHWQEITPPKD